jgi:hypothetical protein
MPIAESPSMTQISNSVELLEQALAMAKARGFVVRSELLEGIEGGHCRIGRRDVIFIDPSTTAAEQLSVLMPILQQTAQPTAKGKC